MVLVGGNWRLRGCDGLVGVVCVSGVCFVFWDVCFWWVFWDEV